MTKPFPMSVFQKKLSVVLGRLAKQSGGGDNYEDGALSINFSEMTASLSGKPLVFTPLAVSYTHLPVKKCGSFERQRPMWIGC